MATVKARPIQTRIGVSFFERGQARYFVRDSLTGEPFGPVNYPQAEAQARTLSRENDVRAAELFVYVRGEPRVVAFYRAGRKLLSGRIAEENSERVFSS